MQTRTLISRTFVSILAAAALAGCATVPAPLQGQFSPLSPRDAVASGQTGAPVRWGGRIVSADPLANRTCFEVVSTPLGSNTRPEWARDDTGGRFIACRAGFYDPAVFQPDREVTVAGRIEGYETRRIGEYDYRFPRVAADVVYLWPQRREVDVISRPYPYFHPWPWWGYW